METYDVIVAGAGFGGLTCASLLASQGYRVVLCEASGELGGAAGGFHREGYRFAAGATVGMGFEPGGYFDRLYGTLGLESPKLHSLERIMQIAMPEQTVDYWRDRKRWHAECERQFPGEARQIADFYDEVEAAGELLRYMTERRPFFPPAGLREWASLLPHLNPRMLRWAPLLTQTVGDRLRKYGLSENSPFGTFLNGQLMDSVQTTASRCPALLGLIALTVFHQGAFAIQGGLPAVAEALAGTFTAAGGEIRYRTPIRSIERQGEGWLAVTKRGEQLTAKQLVLNTSMHSLGDLLGEHAPSHLHKLVEAERLRAAWSAFTLYIGLQPDSDMCKLFGTSDAETWTPFRQVIGQSELPLSEGNQFLVSWLDAGAGSPGPTLTLSTHTAPEPWWDRTGYEQRKLAYQDKMLALLYERYPAVQEHCTVVLPGTPVTFHRYLGRRQGRVGGYIPQGARSLFDAFNSRLGPDGLWMVGDTVFPGAGTLGASLSGWMAAERIAGQRFS